MHYNRASAFCLFWFTVVVGTNSPVEACGNGLRDSIMCLMAAPDVPFKVDLELCTNVSIGMGWRMNCSNDECVPIDFPGFHKLLKWLQPNKTVGTMIFINQDTDKYLSENETRIAKTAEAWVGFMEKYKLTHMFLFEQLTAAPDGNETNVMSLLEKLRRPFKERGWHLGFYITTNLTDIATTLDIKYMSEFVDWFVILQSDFYRHDEGIPAYMEPMMALSSKHNKTGTLEHWIQHLLHLVKPECIIVQIRVIGWKFEGTDKNVEPGPGSLFLERPKPIPRRLLCNIIANPHKNGLATCNTHWDKESSTPYSACGGTFLTYDNVRSIKAKTELARKYNVAGVSLFVRPPDEVSQCDPGVSFPDLRAIQGIRHRRDSTETFGSGERSQNSTETTPEDKKVSKFIPDIDDVLDCDDEDE